MDVTQIKQIAARNGSWKMVYRSGKKIVFRKRFAFGVNTEGDIKITVYPRLMSVDTEMFHPKSGKYTCLERTNVDEKLLGLIFHWPRIHTDRGTYKKYDTPKKTTVKKLSKPRR